MEQSIFKRIMDLYAPVNDEGERDPTQGVISREEAMDLLSRVERCDRLIDGDGERS